VQNLPTDELFTAPHRASATGRVRVARPVSYAGRIMEGIELEFSRGIVTGARAGRGEDVLRELLATDEGAARLGEVAFIPGESALRRAGRLFHHPLLDENALPHVALGAAYRFCLDSFFPFGLNRSLLHVDLPLEATLEFDPPA
jgi:aminopeptidase